MQPLLLLHGAIGAPDQLLPLAERLGGMCKVFTPGFSGHGDCPASASPFSIQLFAEDVLQFMEQNQLDTVSILGYSMGGYVALYLAKNYPEKIDKVITLATKFHWDAETAESETQKLNSQKIEQKLPDFAETLKQRHLVNDWKTVLQKTAEMMISLGNNNTLSAEDYRNISAPTLLLLGDRDKMVTLEETVAVYRSLPDARMGVLPGMAHPIEQADLEALSFNIAHFL